jgi:hypothetical protein
MALSMAPHAGVLVFEGNDEDEILSAMATSDPLPWQLSASWAPFCNDGTSQQLLYEFAVQGQSFSISSGDDGAYSATHQDTLCPYLDGTTLVGGTQLTLGGTPEARLAPAPGEVAWPGSGGGTILGSTLPTYQSGLTAGQNDVSASLRNVPDVALAAYDVTIVNDNRETRGQGTSISSPLWAGFLALVNQRNASAGLPPVGFVNPALYAIGESSQSTFFNDIVSGNNASTADPMGHSAGTGYDLVTGWGSPQCTLIPELACPTTCGTGRCVNLDTDPTHCGSCTVACSFGFTCAAGQCLHPALSVTLANAEFAITGSNAGNCVNPANPATQQPISVNQFTLPVFFDRNGTISATSTVILDELIGCPVNGSTTADGPGAYVTLGVIGTGVPGDSTLEGFVRARLSHSCATFDDETEFENTPQPFRLGAGQSASFFIQACANPNNACGAGNVCEFNFVDATAIVTNTLTADGFPL